MYSLHPTVAVRLAKQLNDEQIRDAEARRVARDLRREARGSSATSTLRRWACRVRLMRPLQDATAELRRVPSEQPR